MTQFRSSSILLDHLDREIAWRRREIHELTGAVKRAQGRNVNVYVRAGLSMLYAHWEGFVRDAANSYVNFLSYRADAADRLLPCFLALSLRSKIQVAASSSRSKVIVPVVDHIVGSLGKPLALPRVDAISAESNLSSIVFESIAGWIGIDTADYSMRYPLIDDVLLANRNAIAHGEYLLVSRDRYLELVDELLYLIRLFKRDIENAVAQELYLVKPSAPTAAA